MVIKCMIHQDNDIDSFCISCKLLLCQECKVDHDGHEFGDESLFLRNTTTIDERLHSLWNMVQKTIGLISHHQKQKETIHLFFEQFYNFLMIEERKLLKPVEAENDKNQKKLDTLLQTIDSLMSTLSVKPIINIVSDDNQDFQPDYDQNSYLYSYYDKPASATEDEKNFEKQQNHSLKALPFDQLKELVAQYESIEQFIKEHTSNNNQEHSNIDNNAINDNSDISLVKSTLPKNDSNSNISNISNYSVEELYNQIVKIEDTDMESVQSKLKSYDNGVESDILCGFGFDTELLEKVKNEFKQVYEIDFSTIEEKVSKEDKRSNRIDHIYIVGGVICDDVDLPMQLSMQSYNVITNEWSFIPTQMESALIKPINNVFTSGVNTGTHIYLFGGNQESNCYYCFDIESKSWLKPMSKRMLARGGLGISACYDGSKYIYLTGGFEGKHVLDRIDRFDTTSGQFVTDIGKLSEPLYGAYTFYHNDLLYVIGGWKKEPLSPNNSKLSIYKLQAPSISQSNNSLDQTDNNSNIDMKSSVVSSTKSKKDKKKSSKKDKNSNNNNSNILIEDDNIHTSLVLEIELKSTSGIEKCCFDPLTHHIYYMGLDDVFFRISIDSNSIEILPPLPLENNSFGASLVYGIDNLNNRCIYLIGGEQQKTFSFNINSSEWIELHSPPYPTTFQSSIALLENNNNNSKINK